MSAGDVIFGKIVVQLRCDDLFSYDKKDRSLRQTTTKATVFFIGTVIN